MKTKAMVVLLTLLAGMAWYASTPNTDATTHSYTLSWPTDIPAKLAERGFWTLPQTSDIQSATWATELSPLLQTVVSNVRIFQTPRDFSETPTAPTIVANISMNRRMAPQDAAIIQNFITQKLATLWPLVLNRITIRDFLGAHAIYTDKPLNLTRGASDAAGITQQIKDYIHHLQHDSWAPASVRHGLIGLAQNYLAPFPNALPVPRLRSQATITVAADPHALPQQTILTSWALTGTLLLLLFWGFRWRVRRPSLQQHMPAMIAATCGLLLAMIYNFAAEPQRSLFKTELFVHVSLAGQDFTRYPPPAIGKQRQAQWQAELKKAFPSGAQTIWDPFAQIFYLQLLTPAPITNHLPRTMSHFQQRISEWLGALTTKPQPPAMTLLTDVGARDLRVHLFGTPPQWHLIWGICGILSGLITLQIWRFCQRKLLRTKRLTRRHTKPHSP